jgi:GntR family transcriptional regulator, rspAB operon transcriptional repressor
MPFTVYSQRMAHETAKQYAYRILRRNILLLDMPPGMTIVEKDICSHLNVSRTPVREALLELARERLVDIVPQRKTHVTLLDEQLVEQGRFLRETVELAILELACKGIAPNFIEALEENLAEQAHFAGDKNIISFFNKDSEFHKLLFIAVDKETVYEAISLFIPHFTRERMLRLQMFDPIELLHDHKQIILGIQNHDFRTARLYLKRHLDRVICDQKILKEAFPDFFRSWEAGSRN